MTGDAMREVSPASLVSSNASASSMPFFNGNLAQTGRRAAFSQDVRDALVNSIP